MSYLNMKYGIISASLSILVLLIASCGTFYTDIINQNKILLSSSSNSKEIISFSFMQDANPGLTAEAIGVINGTIITVTLPQGMDVTNLVATFNTSGKIVSIGGISQVSGVTSNNFTDNVIYTVMASDSTTKDYVITVKVLGAFNITSFLFTKAANPGLTADAIGVIDGSNITVTIPQRTDITNLVATYFTTGKYVSVNGVTQVNGFTRNNFSGKLIYTITANDATTKDYVITVIISYPLEAQWAKTMTNGSNNSWFFSISTTLDSSIYASGYIYGTGTYDFGNGVTAAGTYSGFNLVLVKYNSSGIAQWARTVIGGGGNSSFYSVSSTSDGSVYAAGSFLGTGTFNFGNGVTAAGTYSDGNLVLVKYNSSGNAQWAKSVTGGSNISSFNSISITSDGSVYAAGYIKGTGTFNFGNGVTAAGTYSGGNLVLVKYNSSGIAQWARTVIGGGSDSSFSSVSSTSDGSVYAAGSIYGTSTVDFGNGVTATGTYSGGNPVLAKYNSSGNAQWARTVIGGGGDSSFSSVSSTSDGSVYAEGSIYVTSAVDLGNGVTAAGTYSGNNLVLVKYNSSGIAQWAKSVTAGSNTSTFYSVSSIADGSVYAAGYIKGTGTFDFGNGVTTAVTYHVLTLVLVKYNSSGIAQWAKSVTGGSYISRFSGVSAISNSSVYAAGYIEGTGTFDFGNGVTAAGTYNVNNIILVKYQ
jgi:hypothetical protein